MVDVMAILTDLSCPRVNSYLPARLGCSPTVIPSLSTIWDVYDNAPSYDGHVKDNARQFLLNYFIAPTANLPISKNMNDKNVLYLPEEFVTDLVQNLGDAVDFEDAAHIAAVYKLWDETESQYRKTRRIRRRVLSPSMMATSRSLAQPQADALVDAYNAILVKLEEKIQELRDQLG
ncbi:hypothetical protein BU23DRAFT_662852 [Bimuria novae-zelandiae CBS 107.79]|uniref:Uncharacterized protein n=1 Tax=Bimuria novae-zelandiae CBS 107.79 TaxID=1447943 RepID=A0A6A5VJ38_9PLEO|nr:hypothetical protein BU23DRAFT_662852 [Bimuria novae-zelandiae CBS 107.79]